MRPKQVIVWQLVRDVVAKTNTAVIAELQRFDPLIAQVNFQPGTIMEINETLQQMTGGTQAYQRYPLFGMLLSFDENKGQTIGQDCTVDCRFIIARRSNSTDKVPERYDKNFIPVLYPVYLEVLNQFYLDPRFDTQTPDNIPHIKTDFPYFDTGETDKDPLSDTVDAIQIKIKLRILFKNC